MFCCGLAGCPINKAAIAHSGGKAIYPIIPKVYVPLKSIDNASGNGPMAAAVIIPKFEIPRMLPRCLRPK